LNNNTGIDVEGAAATNVLIGGTTTNTRNLISGGNGSGVLFLNGGTGGVVEGNYIGTDINGAAPLGNGAGVLIQNTSGVTIGGTAAGAGNQISGNSNGILLAGNASGNLIQGNLIGTDATGTHALGNNLGVVFSGGGSNTIGGTSAAARNVVSGNQDSGINLTGSDGNLIQGNYIGADVTGALALGNQAGVTVAGNNNTIGGSESGAGNIISGNRVNGIDVNGAGNIIQGNYIGTDITGTHALANSSGVSLNGASNTLIGGLSSRQGNLISGNQADAVSISNGSGNQIEGNYLGVDASGAHALGNTRGLIVRSSGNNILGNVISGNRSNGMELDLPGGDNNAVQGNYIGTDATGSVALANNGVGIAIQTSGNLIGGTGARQGNVISGNVAGIQIFLPGSGNTIQGNRIGTDAAGAAALPNMFGINVGAGANTIGGTTAGAGNVISGNSETGVLLFTSGNLVQGNYIGTDAGGTIALGNTNGILASASNNTIGGTVAGAGNIISGNHIDGVLVIGLGIVIQGNYIGTDVSGSSSVGNAFGVSVSSSNNTIGGTASGAGNVISGNVSYGLYIQAGNNNLVEGNYLGTDATGTIALGNSYDIRIDSSNNMIGGSAAGARNLIAGSFNGVFVSSGTGNVIQGNFIGTDVTGNYPLGNTFGVNLSSSSSHTTVGGSTFGAGNLISGNLSGGLEIISSDNTVQGNRIGTDATGTFALANGGNGVTITNGSNNLIGGTTPGAGNLISANSGDGIGAAASAGMGTGNVIQGNTIGTDITGVLPLGNARGINLNNMTLATIGGAAPGAGNLISGNTGDGIFFFVGSNNLIQGNLIGTDINGTLPLGNGANGIHFTAGAHNNTMGGTAPPARNTIAFNGNDGVLLQSGVGNAIRANSIFANAGLGIRLLDGANNNQPAPVLTSASSSRGFLTIQGTLTAARLTTYTLEFFANMTADPSGFGQGERFLGFITVTTDASGHATFAAGFASDVQPGEFLSATATDPANNTSAFSQDVLITA
jgi:hypothetical protein